MDEVLNYLEAPKEIYIRPYWMPGVYDDDWHEKENSDKDVKYIRSDLAQLTIDDIERIHTLLDAVRLNKTGAFTFTRLKPEQYAEVLKRFNNVKGKV